MENDYYVEIVSYKTKDIVDKYGPMSEKQAHTFDSVLNRALLHEKYYTRIEGGMDNE